MTARRDVKAIAVQYRVVFSDDCGWSRVEGSRVLVVSVLVVPTVSTLLRSIGASVARLEGLLVRGMLVPQYQLGVAYLCYCCTGVHCTLQRVKYLGCFIHTPLLRSHST